jgi:ribosomal protein L15E
MGFTLVRFRSAVSVRAFDIIALNRVLAEIGRDQSLAWLSGPTNGTIGHGGLASASKRTRVTAP